MHRKVFSLISIKYNLYPTVSKGINPSYNKRESCQFFGGDHVCFSALHILGKKLEKEQRVRICLPVCLWIGGQKEPWVSKL